jgi:hypothetical protein
MRLLVGGADASVAEQAFRAADVAEPCDTSGDATLVSDMGSGRWQRLLARAHDRCRRRTAFQRQLARRLERDP